MTKMSHTDSQVVIVGAGFGGLATAHELAKSGIRVTVLESDNEVGGLASSFNVGDAKLDRFYHIWYTNDYDVLDLVKELGLSENVITNPTNASIYYANNFFKLSKVIDLLRFRPLAFRDRIRLGLLVSRARAVKNWSALEEMTAHDWLRSLGGENVYRVVWQPLLKGKFGEYAEEISAVWFWNKLKLRSASRRQGGGERFAYLKGGFATLAEALANRIRELGGRIHLNSAVSKIHPDGTGWSVETVNGAVYADRVIMTPPLPVIADMVRDWVEVDYVKRLERVRYIGNTCLVLELDRPLTQSYWLNVNDPTFPFVALIEHTNLAASSDYGGRHIVYVSKYMPPTDQLFSLSATEFLDYSLPYLQRMFPLLKRNWILAHHLWRAKWSQPIIERGYSKLMPPVDAPRSGLHICTMAQIYPEDRGTNYAIRAGTALARRLAAELTAESAQRLSTESMDIQTR